MATKNGTKPTISASVTKNDLRLALLIQKKLDHTTLSETIRHLIRKGAEAEGVK